MAFQKIRYETGDDGIATITLDDPASRNALGTQTLDELIAAFETARDDAAVRVVVLASSHETVFSSGGDLSEFGSDAPIVSKHEANSRFPRLFRLILELGKPTICSANGHVLAGSLGVALACDLVIASEDAAFGTPEINVGIFPFMIMALIYRNVGRKKTNEMLLLGERMTAHEALAEGIVNRVVEPAELEGTVRAWAEKLAAKSPLMLRLGKEAMFRQLDMPFVESVEYLRQSLTIGLATDDAREGVNAFFDKREPAWSGR